MSAVDRFWQSRDGLTLHARDYAAAAGEARLPVLCLHGLTRNARDFEMLAPRLTAGGRRVLAIDIRGRGGSAWDPAANYRVPAYADDIARLLDVGGIARALFVGTSMGGLITMALASTRPDAIAGAIINDIGPELAPAGLARIGGYVGNAPIFAGWQAAADHLRAQNGHALPYYTDADWHGMARRMCRQDADGRVRPDYDPAIALPFRDAPSSDDPWTHWQALTKASPVLLLRGSLSDLLTAESAATMAGFGTVELVEIPDVGHAPMLDEPVASAAIDAFLARQP